MKSMQNNTPYTVSNLLLFILISTGLKAQNSYFPQVFFDEELSKKQLENGKHTLKGEVFVKTAVLQQKQYAQNKEIIFLFPVNEYTEEYLRLRKKYPYDYVVMTEKAFQYRIETQADELGNFQFTNLKPGKYLLECNIGYVATGSQRYQSGTNYYGWSYYGVGYVTSSPVYSTYYYKYNTNKALKKIVEINAEEPVQYTKLRDVANLSNFGSNYISPKSSLCYSSGQKQYGTCKDFFANGKIKIVADWKDHMYDGEYTEYDEKGYIIAEGDYEKGYKKGKWKYYKNGILNTEENFKFKYNQSALEGEAKIYYPNGKVKSQSDYKDGFLHGKSNIYYETGSKKEVANYKFGKPEGELLVYYPNGKLEYKQNFKDGLAQGYYETYYDTGEKESSGNYINNKVEGEVIFLNKDGSVKTKKTFVNGEDIQAKKTTKKKK